MDIDRSPLRRLPHLFLLLLLVLPLAALSPSPAAARQAEAGDDEIPPPVDPRLFQTLDWRNIGPYRGGRATAVAGVAQQPDTYYFGATGGGVWKSEDAGFNWRNVSDGHFKTGSVGAIAVAPSDPNVVYVGMGEAPIRGVTTSSGDGVYRSTDGGDSWRHLGLEATRQISAIVVDPADPDRVWVAAQGDPYRATEERGVYRSEDGGESWDKVLYVDQDTGISGLVGDPSNPRLLYAATWQHRRLPWKIESGGPGSGIHRSTDGGDSWQRLDKGLPELMGKTDVALSPAEPDRVWVLAEADGGGLFRSDNGGDSFRRVNGDRELIARAWYYIHLFADPQDENTVYVLNAPMLKSVDGGATFERIQTPHGDNHALWINPDDNRLMVQGNDGGANVSINGGATWSTQANQPTAQFYRVITDNRFPYYVYGGQQDNTTVAVPSRSRGGGILAVDWEAVGGCESAHVAFDPNDPRYVYAGCYQGLISEYDQQLKTSRDIMAYPVLGLGSKPSERRYRFNWNAPIVADPHDWSTIYHAGNVVLKTTDRGATWQEISPDLTRDEEAKQGYGGGPITNEGAGGETYNTILSLAVSRHQQGTIWAGSDDGLVHLTRDGGASWQQVTPPGAGEAMINSIEVSSHDPAAAYLAVTRYKFGDFTPLIYATGDYGASWQRRDDGIPDGSFVRVVREDPKRRGLLYAGTERGLFVSFDDGVSWQPFQLDLPVVPITDLTIRYDDLVAATQGRSFWLLDDLTPLHTIPATLEEVIDGDGEHAELLPVRDTYFVRGDGRFGGGPAGQNPPRGALIHYLLSEEAAEALAGRPDGEKDGEEGEASEDGEEDQPADDPAPAAGLTLEILDAGGTVVGTFHHGEQAADPDLPAFFGIRAARAPSAKVGLNRFIWTLESKEAAAVEGTLAFPRPLYEHAPGRYTARLTLELDGEEEVHSRPFTVVGDPRVDSDPSIYDDQQELLREIWTDADDLRRTVNRLREVRSQVAGLVARVEAQPHDGEEPAESDGTDDRQALFDQAAAVTEAIDELEDRLLQTKQETFQDVINFPGRLNAELLSLLGTVTGSPHITAGHRERYGDLAAAWREAEVERDRILGEMVPELNRLVAAAQVPAVIVPAAEAPDAGARD